MRLLGIDHVVLRVLDPAVMERFYVEVLGCAVERRQDEIGLLQLRAGAQLIDLVDVAGRLGRAGGAGPGEGGRNMDHLCLRVIDFEVEAVRAHLEAQGVKVGDVGLRYGSTGEAVSLYLSDPEGNGLELRA
ncbi:lactoylglutathione lyase-like lyase [Caulobacter sp. AP07]|uniref:VOC family protein n=1 Tax=Caulobacter sp. AP07 TaxID=1144304 RepID=UPI0002720B77|nr:VOC family protein [Caulobacter sp. AP07]EJL38101.1 lactoylglutathione lyase-like lyase [Caulobacter sp. AP07]